MSILHLLNNKLSFIFLCLCLVFVCAATCSATTFNKDRADSASQSFNKTIISSVSPLLSLCYYGFNKYKSSTNDKDLPFYAKKEFLTLSILLLLSILFKDTIGTFFGPLKMPLDALDVVQNKAMAVICMFGVVPEMANSLKIPTGIVLSYLIKNSSIVGSAYASSGGIEQINLDLISWWISYALGVLCFYAVWSSSHVVNVLSLLSPIPLVGGILKLVRLGLLSLILLASSIHPLLGVAVSIVVLIAAFKMTTWATRLMIFGLTVSVDLFGRRWKDTTPSVPIRAFSSYKLANIPRRVYGDLDAESGLSFSYRPFMIFPRKTILIEPLFTEISIRRALLCPTIVATSNNKSYSLFLLSPRYRTHELQIGQYLGINVNNHETSNKIKAAMHWIHELLNSRKVVFGSSI